MMTQTIPVVKTYVWQGVAIQQGKLLFPGESWLDRKDNRKDWPLAWLDPMAEGFTIERQPEDEDLAAWIEMSRQRIDQLTEARDERVKKSFRLSSHDGRFTTHVRRVKSSAGSVFSSRNVKLYRIRIEEKS